MNPPNKQVLIPYDTRMSAYGYWVVRVGCASGQFVDIMVAQTGISPMQAEALAMSGVSHVTNQGGTQ